MVVPTAPSQNKLAQAFLCCALLVGREERRCQGVVYLLSDVMRTTKNKSIKHMVLKRAEGG